MGFRTCSSLKFHSVSFRISPLSPPVQAPTWVNLHFPHRLTITTTPFASCDRLCLRSSCAVACSRRAQPGNDLSSSAEGERGGSDLKYDANNLGNLNSKADGEVQEHQSYQSSVRTVALCVCTAAAFGLGVGFKDGAGKASEFFAGYILEQSLSVDNLFVFVLIFKYFKVPFKYQNRVLSYGIAGAIIFRLTLILLGTATLQRFEAVNLLLAVILLYSSFKLFTSEEDDSDLSDNFIVKACQRFIPVTNVISARSPWPNWCSLGALLALLIAFLIMMATNFLHKREAFGKYFCFILTGVQHFEQATPLLLTVAVIELSDIAFAVDSIPAVFGVTRDPFIVFTSNLFAILGLRSLYTLISEGMADLEYLQPSIGVVLGFIGCKMILDFFGFHISTEASLGFVATSLSAGVLLSLMKKPE